MASDGQIVFEVTADGKHAIADIKEITRAIQQESKKWDNAAEQSTQSISDGFSSMLKKVVGGISAAKIGQMLLNIGKDALQAASDLEEVQNVVDVTFGTEGAAKIEEWSKAAGKQFGLTELQAKRYASTLGAMMKSSGLTENGILELSTDLAGLAADMASFYNLPFDEAFSKIQSGMAGMSMPLRQLGIDMTETAVAAYAAEQGFEGSFNSLSQGEQTLLRYQYLMHVTADAQGDFVRTSDSYANTQRRIATGFDTLKAQLGEALLPIATEVSNAVADLLDVLTYRPPETAFDVAEEAMNDAAASATQAQGILGYMDKLQEKYGEAASETGEWASALERLKQVMPGVNEFINEETGALTATNEQLHQYVENRKQALIEEAKANAIKKLNDEYTQAGMDYYTAEINRDIANEQALEAVKNIIDYMVSDFESRGFGEDEATAEWVDRDKWLEAFQSGNVTMQDLMYYARAAADNKGESQSLVERYEQIYNEQSAAAKSASSEMEALAEKMVTLETDLNIANAALERLSNAAGTAAQNISGLQAPEGSFASGLDYVPHDGFRAILHRGERIQTAAEAHLMRQMWSMPPGIDYGAFGAAMWADAPKMGGNVYLDGRVVGSVISDQQGKAYRQLTRSGWQA